MDLLTAEGYDLQFGTVLCVFLSLHPGLTSFQNTLGHYHFTTLLLPILTRTAALPDGPKHVRVINTSSLAHTLVNKIDYETLTDTPKRRTLHTMSLYNQSKLVCN